MVRKRSCASFNPCCYGYRSSTPVVSNVVMISVEVSILVVMDTAPQRHHRPQRPGGTASFNPCCYGYRSSTPARAGPFRDDDIVSILVVMDTAPQPRRRLQ